jgi:hypothetical protein
MTDRNEPSVSVKGGKFLDTLSVLLASQEGLSCMELIILCEKDIFPSTLFSNSLRDQVIKTRVTIQKLKFNSFFFVSKFRTS